MMHSYELLHQYLHVKDIVLILVLMDDALVPKYYFLEVLLREVLILVLMDDALVPKIQKP